MNVSDNEYLQSIGNDNNDNDDDDNETILSLI